MSGQPTVVVVEEASLSRSVLMKALSSWGYACMMVGDGMPDWVLTLPETESVLILADWAAPFMNCRELFRKVRALTYPVPPYLLAAIMRGAGGLIQESVSAGADDFVYRPYDLDEVRVRLAIACRLMRCGQAGHPFSL